MRRTGIKRRMKSVREFQQGRRKPMPRHKPRPKDGQRSLLWQATKGAACSKCGLSIGRLVLHHVVYEQHVRSAKGDVFDARNGLTLCVGCHMLHHSPQEGGKLELRFLRDLNYEFAFELLGLAAYDYMRRHYAGEDSRLDALLDPERKAAA